MLVIACEATQKIRDFDSHHISITTWAFAKLDIRYDPWITAMVKETLLRLPEHNFTPQHVSNIAWALGSSMIKSELRIGADCWHLMLALATEASDRIHEFDPQALSNISWSLSRLGLRHDAFMDKLALEVPAKLPSYPSLDIANMAYAFGKMGRPFPTLTGAMLRETEHRLGEWSDGEIARMVWAFSLLHALEERWLDVAVARFAECRASRLPNLPTLEGHAVLHIVNCCAQRRRQLRAWPEVLRYFHSEIYKPTLLALEAIKHNPDESEIDNLVDRMQELITWLDIDYLGPHYTRCLLWQLRLADPSDARAGDGFAADWVIPGLPHEPLPPEPSWGSFGRAQVEAAVAETKLASSDLVSSAFDCFGPHERRIIAWFSYNLEVHVPSSCSPGQLLTPLREGGRIARFIDDEQRRVAVRGERTFEFLAAGGAGEELARAIDEGALTLDDVSRAQKWLPGLVAQHGRLGHCERQGLLEIIFLVMATAARASPDARPEALQSGMFDGSCGVSVSGEIHLYVAHFCCISCLAVMCHFARRLPGIRLYVDYDDCWQTRTLDV